MEFRPDAAGEVVRPVARELFGRLVTDEVRDRVRTTGTLHDTAMHAALCADGWLTSAWPAEDGGQGRTALEMEPFYEEAIYAEAPIVGGLTTMLVAETLRRIGTPLQRETILKPIVEGSTLVCLGLSEPETGSDVAAARTRAVRDGDSWLVNGQKMFTTMAHDADFVFLLARTNTEVPKHRGLTMFIIPMTTPGIEVQRVDTLGGERTNITFYSDVEVPDTARVGDVDRGWDVLLITLTYERGLTPTAGLQCSHLDDLLERWATETQDDEGRRPIDTPAVRTRLARHRARTEVARLLGRRSIWTHDQGGMPVVEGSMAKLFAAEHLYDLANDAIEMVGPAATIAHGQPGAILDGAFEHIYRHSPVEAIYGGTSEIQRGILASQHLHLPRG